MATLLNNPTQKALTTLARLKAFLGTSGDSKDTMYTILINQATGFIERYTKRRLLTQTYTNEEYDGTGTGTLVLRQFPVTAFTKLEVNTSGDSSDAWQEADGNTYHWYEDGRVVLVGPTDNFLSQYGGKFVCEPNKYRVTYTAGYKIDFDNENDTTRHTLPQELEYACMQLTGGYVNNSKGLGLSSAKVGDVAMTFRQGVSDSPEIKEILGKYASATV